MTQTLEEMLEADAWQTPFMKVFDAWITFNGAVLEAASQTSMAFASQPAMLARALAEGFTIKPQSEEEPAEEAHSECCGAECTSETCSRATVARVMQEIRH